MDDAVGLLVVAFWCGWVVFCVFVMMDVYCLSCLECDNFLPKVLPSC